MATEVQITAKKIDTGDIRYLTINGDNIDTVNFHFPRFYNGKDLSLGTAQLLYKRPDGTGDADLLTVTTTETEITASWDIRPNFTCLTGKAYISVRVILESNLWQSFTAPVIVERTIAPSDLQCEPTVFDQYLYMFEVIRNETIAAKEDAEAAAEYAESAITDPNLIIVAEDLALAELSNIKIVAGGIIPVRAVGENIDNVNAIANDLENIDTIMTNIEHIDTVANNIIDVQAVGENIAHVVAVSENEGNINAVVANELNINAVNANAENIIAVAENEANINAVNANKANIDTVANNSININNVAAIDTDVTAVSAIDSQIAALALITSEIVNVNAISTEVTTVSANMLQILGVYAKLTEITAVYGKIPEIDALYAQLDTIALKANQSEVDAIKGTGYTEGSLKTHEDRLDTLEGADTVVGSVAKAVKDALEPIIEDVSDHETRIDSVELAIVQQGQDLASVKQTLQQGNGATLDFSDIGIVPLDARATGRANPTIEGLMATNIVDGAGIANLGTVTFASVLNHKYFDVLHGTILTGTGSDMTITNDTGATADVAVINLTQTFGASNEPTEADCAKLFSNYFDGTKSISMPARVRSVGKNLFDLDEADTISQARRSDTGALYTQTGVRSTNHIPIESMKTFTLSGFGNLSSLTAVLGISFYDSNKKYISGVVSSNNFTTFTTPLTASFFITNYRIDTFPNIQLELGSTATPYEPYTDSTLYIADNEELRSVQAVSDTVSVVNGENMLTKKISTPVSVASGVAVNVTNYPTAKTGGKFAVELTAGGTQIGVIGTDSTSGAGTLRFELDTPVITNLLTSGTLKAFQNGTVYFEPYYEGSHQTDASSQITLPYEGTIEAVYGYDEDLVEYLLDSSEYSLTGTTLTITDALENEVFYVELSRSEPLAPEMGVNTLNNMVVPTIVNASTYTVLEGDHTLLVNYTATGACAITIPTALILAYKRLVIKDSGGGAATKNIIIGTQGTEKIDGADTYVINTAKGKVELASDGANMWVVG